MPRDRHQRHGHISTGVAARRLGIGSFTILKLVRDGVLRPTNEKEPWQFDEDEIDNIATIVQHALRSAPTKPKATTAANAFRLFDKGCVDVREAVLKLKIPPREVLALFHAWQTQDLRVLADERSPRSSAPQQLPVSKPPTPKLPKTPPPENEKDVFGLIPSYGPKKGLPS